MSRKKLENIRNEVYEKQFQIGEDKCRIILEDACYGDWDGQSQVLDKICVDEMCEGIAKVIAKHSTKYNPVPARINIRYQKEEPEIKKSDTKEMMTSRIPRYSLDQVILPSEVKEQLDVTLSAIHNRDRLNEEWGMGDTQTGKRAIVLNFYGHAGTGKSMTAEAIAHDLHKKCLVVNYSELESKYVGETPKNIKRVFAEAAEEDAVLVFDEADSFLGKRLTNITQSADYGVNITRSVMLMELEKFEGIVVFTTNLIENYDTAFKRRIFASIEFGLPDERVRSEIWKLHMGSKLPLASDVTSEFLAKKYDGVTGADIKDIVYYAAVYAMRKEKSCVGAEEFDKAHQYVMKRYA